jgi:hypothetical protein
VAFAVATSVAPAVACAAAKPTVGLDLVGSPASAILGSGVVAVALLTGAFAACSLADVAWAGAAPAPQVVLSAASPALLRPPALSATGLVNVVSPASPSPVGVLVG